MAVFRTRHYANKKLIRPSKLPINLKIIHLVVTLALNIIKPTHKIPTDGGTDSNVELK